jgi:hypothetical protein
LVGNRKSFLNSCLAFLSIAMLILFEATLSSSIVPVIPADAFSLPYHKYITDEALSFLKQPILGEIFKASLHSDTVHQFFTPEYHFDDCKFQESSQLINRLYENLPYDMNPKTFGKILHAAADFYAHSNWIEMGKSDLIDEEKFEWTVLPKMKLLEKHDVFVIQGEESDIPPGYDLSRAPGEKVVKVTAPDGKVYPGLITGTAYLTDDCPDKYRGQDIAISHFDRFAGGKGQGLNKDKPGINGFEKAVELAIAQTQHEWCRLVNLVEREQGEEGKQKLFDEWVADKAAAEKTPCPPPEWTGEITHTAKLAPAMSQLNDIIGHEESGAETFQFTGTFSLTIDKYEGGLSLISGRGEGYVVVNLDGRLSHTELEPYCIYDPPECYRSYFPGEYAYYHGEGPVSFTVEGEYAHAPGTPSTFLRLTFTTESLIGVSGESGEEDSQNAYRVGETIPFVRDPWSAEMTAFCFNPSQRVGCDYTFYFSPELAYTEPVSLTWLFDVAKLLQERGRDELYDGIVLENSETISHVTHNTKVTLHSSD